VARATACDIVVRPDSAAERRKTDHDQTGESVQFETDECVHF
jgi:hypothetical protein